MYWILDTLIIAQYMYTCFHKQVHTCRGESQRLFFSRKYLNFPGLCGSVWIEDFSASGVFLVHQTLRNKRGSKTRSHSFIMNKTPQHQFAELTNSMNTFMHNTVRTVSRKWVHAKRLSKWEKSWMKSNLTDYHISVNSLADLNILHHRLYIHLCKGEEKELLLS